MKTRFYLRLGFAWFFVSMALIASALGADEARRQRLSIDQGWKFHLGNDWGIAQNLAKSGTGFGPAGETFSDLSWRSVDLPHDWAVELPFDQRADVAHGFKALGEKFPQNSVAWYRRTFELPASDAGQRLWLEFDGIYRNSTVFVNGWCMAHQESGYSGFRVDITDVANCGGKNVVAVFVDASQSEGWFYEGAGIYRHVWLVKTGPVAVAPDGVFVYSTFANAAAEGPAQVHLQTRVANAQGSATDVSVEWEIHAPDGARVASGNKPGHLDAAGAITVEHITSVNTPELWSPETPRLYTLTTRVVGKDGQIVDRVDTVFGIRTMSFDPEKGFILNGKPYLIKGTCNHQDHAGVGSALPDRLQEFRILKLKEIGTNAYRTAHHAPTPELLEACDRLGMLVMDENRLLGSDALHLKWFEEQILRDRNHASVVIWSLANEEFTTQATPAGGRVAQTMQALAKRLDPTRPVTYNAPQGDEFSGINAAIEVRGWSYHIGEENMDAYHAAHPKQPNVGSEQGSTVGTRGIYTTDTERGYMSAYDDNAQSWSNTAEQWFSFFDKRPWLSGGFVWTGFDYRGEPTPYGWPCINSHFGIYDTCGFPKDNFWYYKSWWTTAPILHLLPHWNWAGKEGQEIDVRAFSNCEEVELFLNGKTLGRQSMKRASHLRWKVAYAPGTLSAKGYTAGKEVAHAEIQTTGAPASVRLSPETTTAPKGTMNADGVDVTVLAVSILDQQNRVVPTAGVPVSFEIEGPGRIIGVGNGDPSCHEPDVFVTTIPLQTAPIPGWRWKSVPDTYAKTLPETAPEFDDTTWATFDARAETGNLGINARAVLRARFTVTAEQLQAPGVELWFGKVEGAGFVFLNGQKLASTNSGGAETVLDVKNNLKVGENTIAIPLAVYGVSGGISKGAQLRFIGIPTPVKWSRSTFNGLAQVIVQSTRAPGTIKVTARAEGLAPSSVSIRTVDTSADRQK